jgi:adenylate cyclase
MTRIWPQLVRLKLASGVVLFVFVTTHYLNHALGLVSLEVMETGREAFLALWRNPAGKTLLYGGLALHVGLSLAALFRRRSLRGLSAADVVQAVFGLAIVPLLAVHAIGTGLLNSAYGLNDRYAYVLLSLWWFSPWDGVKQSIAVLVVWIHGCIGIHQWLRLKPWYRRASGAIYTLGVVIPMLALLGMEDGARDAIRLLADMNWVERYNRDVVITPEMAAWGFRLHDRLMMGLVALAVILLLARLGVWLYERSHQRIAIAYPGGKQVQVRPGTTTVLEASRLGGIPHASVCGGRGRCSTCRVRLGPGFASLPEPDAEEARVLRRVGAPPGVRLACQIRPGVDLAVTPLLPANATPKEAFAKPDFMQGAEREIAILFADLRQFTRFSESKLPFDVVFVINQFSRQMGSAIQASGGRIDKFIGDGVMALFGIEAGPETGSRRALAAARAMAENLEALNKSLAHDLAEPLRIGIGIHCGAAIVGEMGYATAVTVTAIGDAVNTASRLEAATKDYGAQLVFSREVARRAGLALDEFETDRIEVRGRREPLEVVIVPDARKLPVLETA